VRLVMALVVAVSVASCAPRDSSWEYRNPPRPEMYSPDQTYDLPEVRRRLGGVTHGMYVQEVLRVLGRPGTVYHNGLTYHKCFKDGDRIGYVIKSKDGEVSIKLQDGKVVEISDIADSTDLHGVGGGGR